MNFAQKENMGTKEKAVEMRVKLDGVVAVLRGAYVHLVAAEYENDEGALSEAQLRVLHAINGLHDINLVSILETK